MILMVILCLLDRGECCRECWFFLGCFRWHIMGIIPLSRTESAQHCSLQAVRSAVWGFVESHLMLNCGLPCPRVSRGRIDYWFTSCLLRHQPLKTWIQRVNSCDEHVWRSHFSSSRSYSVFLCHSLCTVYTFRHTFIL